MSLQVINSLMNLNEHIVDEPINKFTTDIEFSNKRELYNHYEINDWIKFYINLMNPF